MISIRAGERLALGLVLDQPEKGVLAIFECAAWGCTWQHAVRCDHPQPGSDACHAEHREEVELALGSRGTHRCTGDPASAMALRPLR